MVDFSLFVVDVDDGAKWANYAVFTARQLC